MNRTVAITPAPGLDGNATITLTVTDPDRLTAKASFLFTVVQPRQIPSRGDFNLDEQADIVFQDRDGALAAWQMNGLNMVAAGSLEPGNVGDINYRIVASADFDRDGQEDLVFQHTDGTLAIWYMDGVRLASTALLEPNNGVSPPDGPFWRAVAAVDLNGDRKPDLIFQAADGTTDIWFMDGIRRARQASLNPNGGGASWRIVGFGDFNGDTKLDFVFQHSDGSLAVWYLDGIEAITGVTVNPGNPGDANLRVVSTADRNGDGKPDLLFQHAADGTLRLWLMDGINLRSVESLNPSTAGGTWKVVAPK